MSAILVCFSLKPPKSFNRRSKNSRVLSSGIRNSVDMSLIFGVPVRELIIPDFADFTDLADSIDN